jgi:hypothetical protein
MPASIRPKPGFNWLRVAWGAPDEIVSKHCSYCDKKLEEDGIPLMLWNDAGWCAQFCETCQTEWWGFSP